MKRSVWLAFAVLCLLSSADWLIPAVAPNDVPALERHALLYCAAGLIGALFSARQARRAKHVLRWAQLGASGLGLFGVPLVFFEWTKGGLSDLTRSVGFATIPLAVVMVVAATLGQDGVRRLLTPALAGLGGILLLLPFDLPSATRDWLMLGGLAAVVVLVASLNVWINRLLQDFSLADAVAVVCLSNAVFLWMCCLMGRDFAWRRSALGSMASVSSLVEASEFILTIWLLRKIAPVRFSVRYLAIPLLTVLEGYIFLRPVLTVRMGFGVALLATGAGMILFSKDAGDGTALSLR